MDKYILISDTIKDLVSYVPEQIYTIIPTSNIIDKIYGILQENNGSLILAILFVNTEDIEELLPFVNRLDSNEIACKLIIIDSEEKLKTLDSTKLLRIFDFRTSNISSTEFNILTRMAFSQIEDSCETDIQKKEYINKLLDMKHVQEDLINIGKSLSTEKSPDQLLKLILFLSKKITGADAGSIYLVEELGDGKKQLRFKRSHTFSKNLPFEEFTLPLDKNSIAGYVAVTGEVLNIPDVYKLSPDDPISFNSSMDKEHNYRCKSMIVVPMRNHIDQIIGVIQLINSKENIKWDKGITGNEAFEIVLETPEDFETKVVSFDTRYEGLMEAVAGQAAVAIENNRMIKQIQNQFESFVKASVSAIESRDVATSGHAFRVAEICKEIARCINIDKSENLKDINFSMNEIKELEYAALLHDFGKVYIDLAIFKKEKKLYPKEFENLILKLNYLYRFIELHYTLQESLVSKRYDTHSIETSGIESLNQLKEEKLERILGITEKVKILNEPTIMEDDPEEMLEKIQNDTRQDECFDIEGKRIDLFTQDERINLQIKRGSLNPLERKEIESHVVHTFTFVRDIPWPPEFRNIPEIVLKHHELLDGSGYPSGISGKESIPIQARMMAIADIYDALVATDRPYKRAVKPEKALAILEKEANSNKLDRDILDIFIKYNIYKKIDKNAFKATQEYATV